MQDMMYLLAVLGVICILYAGVTKTISKVLLLSSGIALILVSVDNLEKTQTILKLKAQNKEKCSKGSKKKS